MPEEFDNAPARPAVKATRASNRRPVVARLWRAARRQLDAHEAHLAALPDGAPASEADARALATLARTVRELVALDAATAEAATCHGDRSADDPDSVAGLRHVGELRAELARRLERLAAAAADETAAAPAAGVDA